MNKKIIFTLLAVIAAASFFYWKKQNLTSETKGKIVRNSIVEAVYGLGRVVSAKTYEYKTGVITQITSLYISEGQQVKKGEHLLALETGGVLTAPFAGTITGLYYQKGENITPNTNVLTLTDLQDRYILVTLEQQGALKVRPNQLAQISIESIREKSFSGTVTSVYSNTQREFAVRIDTKEFPEGILPGMSADVAIVIQEKQNALIAPVAAVQNSSLKVLKNGKWMVMPVKIGLINGDSVEILEGDLKEGDDVLISQDK